jgi:hypothetical protein
VGGGDMIFRENKREENTFFSWKKKDYIIWDGISMEGIHWNLEKR